MVMRVKWRSFRLMGKYQLRGYNRRSLLNLRLPRKLVAKRRSKLKRKLMQRKRRIYMELDTLWSLSLFKAYGTNLIQASKFVLLQYMPRETIIMFFKPLMIQRQTNFTLGEWEKTMFSDLEKMTINLSLILYIPKCLMNFQCFKLEQELNMLLFLSEKVKNIKIFLNLNKRFLNSNSHLLKNHPRSSLLQRQNNHPRKDLEKTLRVASRNKKKFMNNSKKKKKKS